MDFAEGKLKREDQACDMPFARIVPMPKPLRWVHASMLELLELFWQTLVGTRAETELTSLSLIGCGGILQLRAVNRSQLFCLYRIRVVNIVLKLRGKHGLCRKVISTYCATSGQKGL